MFDSTKTPHRFPMYRFAKPDISLALWIFFSLFFFQGCTSPSFDVLIVHGTVYDGLGNPGVQMDIGIRDGKIAALGDFKEAKSEHIIDASGMAVAPGFIDLHAHLEDIPEHPNALSKLHQGVTTVVGG
ncbi:MAG TPA: hypothetical protein VKZ51_13920, partial [Cyclobacteriaceae bacterium]|nr:hypothetical protein [Cyclobacteriaceae bacterium]